MSVVHPQTRHVLVDHLKVDNETYKKGDVLPLATFHKVKWTKVHLKGRGRVTHTYHDNDRKVTVKAKNH